MAGTTPAGREGGGSPKRLDVIAERMPGSGDLEDQARSARLEREQVGIGGVAEPVADDAKRAPSECIANRPREGLRQLQEDGLSRDIHMPGARHRFRHGDRMPAERHL
ncbi:hypothetical protein [Candidatus Amarobacter glycogenicus]|uniref:hypothetical protein n=1 Tax=Candidatus Amarobacter glycogenicus TaxID=3140699 RepID=UPI002A12DFEF|nr:hypothetical protein [Dehalococcoidia bacterium]